MSSDGMTKVLATGAFAAALAFASSSSLDFVGARGAASNIVSPSTQFLGGAVADSPSDAGFAAASALCTGVAAGVVASVAAVRKVKVQRKFAGMPIGEYNDQEKWAGGLVGSEYAGFGGRHEYDPLGLASRFPEHLPWYREAELKHGRVAMLGCLGLIVPDVVRLPVDVLSDPSIDMYNAHKKLIGPGLGEGPMWWLLIFCGIVESFRFKQLGLAFEKLTLENAGDIDFGKGFMPKTEEGQIQMQIKELKNGRLAMLAFSGAITQGWITNNHHFPFV